MKKYKNKQEKSVKGQDFAKPEDESKKPSSHGELANQKHGDFSDLEETRMEHPPKQRDTNGSKKSDNKESNGNAAQENGIT